MMFVCVSYKFFFCKQKTAYEMRISDWSSDVCSSDLVPRQPDQPGDDAGGEQEDEEAIEQARPRIGGEVAPARAQPFEGSPRREVSRIMPLDRQRWHDRRDRGHPLLPFSSARRFRGAEHAGARVRSVGPDMGNAFWLGC